MTATLRRRRSRSKGWRSAAPPSAACARPWGGPPSGGAGPGGLAPAASPAPAWARWSSSTLAFYGDRLNVFLRNDPHWTLAEQLRGTQDPTHFGRMLQSLGVGFIPAGSPQAKGRIEWLRQTLQDRLVSELRLQGITTPEAAHAFLPAFRVDHNRRFARPPAQSRPAWRPPPRELPLLLGHPAQSGPRLRSVAPSRPARRDPAPVGHAVPSRADAPLGGAGAPRAAAPSRAADARAPLARGFLAPQSRVRPDLAGVTFPLDSDTAPGRFDSHWSCG